MLVLLSISVIPPTLSFQTGAPQAACQTLAPDATQHGAQPQATDIPYVLNLSAFYDIAIDQMVYTPDSVYNSKIKFISDHRIIVGKHCIVIRCTL